MKQRRWTPKSEGTSKIAYTNTTNLLATHFHPGPKSIPPGGFLWVSESAVIGSVLLPPSLPSLICLARIHILMPGRCHDVVFGSGRTESEFLDCGRGNGGGCRSCVMRELKWRSMIKGNSWEWERTFEPVDNIAEGCEDSGENSNEVWNKGIVNGLVRESAESISWGSASSL